MIGGYRYPSEDFINHLRHEFLVKRLAKKCLLERPI